MATHTGTHKKETQRHKEYKDKWNHFSASFYAVITLILFNLLLVTLAAVQISYHFCFSAPCIQELKLEMTSYTLRTPKRINTQIHSDYHLLCCLSLSLSFFLAVHLATICYYIQKLHLDKDKLYSRHTRTHRQTLLQGWVAFEGQDNVSWPRPWWLPVIHGCQLH